VANCHNVSNVPCALKNNNVMLDIAAIRAQFPILDRQIYGKPLIYLDNAATSQHPQCVIDRIADSYCRVNANVHRGVHTLSQEATEAHENARKCVQQYINARHTTELNQLKSELDLLQNQAQEMPDVSALEEELTALRAERDALLARVAELEEQATAPVPVAAPVPTFSAEQVIIRDYLNDYLNGNISLDDALKNAEADMINQIGNAYD